MLTTYYLILIVSVALFGSLLTFGAYMLLGRLAMIDQPSARSNHENPVITGAGVGFMVTILSFLVVVNAPPPLVLGGIIVLVVSLIDDYAGLSVHKRIGFQLIAVLLALHVFDGQVFQGLLPVWLDMAVTALLWMWMINLTNFMDGIDELSVTESASITGGIVLLGVVTEVVPQAAQVDALVVLIGVLSFYPWNRHPALCFMGDTGSIPLGFLLGYLLFSLAAAGLWEIALILPAYYICDATLTLLKRVIRGELFWQAHSTHFYQQAVRAGYSHRWVARHIMILNMAFILMAGMALHQPQQAALLVAAAYAFALMVCFYFAARRRKTVASTRSIQNETTA